MDKEITISINIDGKDYQTTKGKSILNVCRENNIEIPTVCEHPDNTPTGSCRMCVVEIEGWRGLHTSCMVKADEGMKIKTDSPLIRKTRKMNLELIAGTTRSRCNDCCYSYNCKVLDYAKEYDANVNRFEPRKLARKVERVGPIILDQTKCIDCRNCVESCPVDFIEVKGRGDMLNIEFSRDENKECIHCGQCIVHCPVSALSDVQYVDNIQEALDKKKDRKKILVAAFAPAVRTSIGEEFWLEYGEVMTDHLTAGLKQLGFDKVFDVAVAADFTTIEEAQEVIERVVKNEKLPAFTSCCPAWVKYLEFYYPQYGESNICTSRSPQMMMGALIKGYWADREGIDPKDIEVVSIMPCVAKKFEADREEMNIFDGIKPIDYVLTVRELARAFKQNGIDLSNIEPVSADEPFGSPSGAGVIYGASGGVYESALRTAYFKIMGKDADKIEIEEVRGLEGVKRRNITIGDITLKVVVVSDIKNAKPLLEELEKDPNAFHMLEMMTCPGGCIGGGGQPIPTSPEIRQKRADALYKIDEKSKVRLAHENPIIDKVYGEYFKDNDHLRHELFHTSYRPRVKQPIEILKDDREIK
jgi:iron-only hydrogenase group A